MILTSPQRPGSLRAEARAKGVEVLLYEAGEGLRFDEAAVKTGVAGILRVLRHKGMIAGRETVARPLSLLCTSSTWLRAPAGGILRSYKADGDRVQPGDLMAVVTDPFGEREATLRAPSAGIVVGRAMLPVVNEGDAIYHLAKVSALGAGLPVVAEPVFDEDEII